MLCLTAAKSVCLHAERSMSRQVHMPGEVHFVISPVAEAVGKITRNFHKWFRGSTGGTM